MPRSSSGWPRSPRRMPRASDHSLAPQRQNGGGRQRLRRLGRLSPSCAVLRARGPTLPRSASESYARAQATGARVYHVHPPVRREASEAWDIATAREIGTARPRRPSHPGPRGRAGTGLSRFRRRVSLLHMLQPFSSRKPYFSHVVRCGLCVGTSLSGRAPAARRRRSGVRRVLLFHTHSTRDLAILASALCSWPVLRDLYFLLIQLLRLRARKRRHRER